ncbi:IFT172 [Scenedesmus sp. PABB004]|nr:IFT172 [Scenedesmus sp. PABB004]
MQLAHLQTLLQAGDGIANVSALAWAPNSAKLAAATHDRVVHLFDDAGERRDKFKTKPADAAGGGGGAYLVTGMAFAPDSCKLAVAQSDSIVFVYRLGADWSEKKSICNKFAQAAPVTCVAWPDGRPSELVLGLANGGVRLAQLRTNRSLGLYAQPDGSYVAALAAAPGGGAVAAAHVDGSVFRVTFPDADPGGGGGGGGGRAARLLQLGAAPTALAWGAALLVATSDCRVAFYDPATGRELTAFDCGGDAGARDLRCAAFSPSGEAAVVGGFGRLLVFALQAARGCWEQVGIKQVDNFYSTTALAWRPDGSRVAAGGLAGALDIYDACQRRVRRARHVAGAPGRIAATAAGWHAPAAPACDARARLPAAGAVVVKTLATGAQAAVTSGASAAASRGSAAPTGALPVQRRHRLSASPRRRRAAAYGYAVEGLQIYQGRFVVARTPSTLLLGDLEACAMSEVAWEADGRERFCFDHEKARAPQLGRAAELGSLELKLASSASSAPAQADGPADGPPPAPQFCLVHRAGELSVVEYGINEPLAAPCTEAMSSFTLSLAAVPRRGVAPAAKRLAYLIDAQTLRVLDLLAPGGPPLATVAHDARIDWLVRAAAPARRARAATAAAAAAPLALHQLTPCCRVSVAQELNLRGSHLLFRDKRHALHLLDLASGARCTLLGFCQYAQVTTIPIKGDVEGIERAPGRTVVLVDEGLATCAVPLDEALIDFGAALEDLDLQRALATLEPLPLSAETEAQWAALAGVALEQEALAVAERCYAALGDLPRARYLHKARPCPELRACAAAAPRLVKAARRAAPDGAPGAPLPTAVRAQLTLLGGRWPAAEALLLAQGQVDEAIAACKDAHRRVGVRWGRGRGPGPVPRPRRGAPPAETPLPYARARRWDDAIRVSDTARHPGTEALRAAHLSWLLSSGQEERAGAVKERCGELLAAIALYLKAGLPARAAQVVIVHGGSYDAALLDSIAAALARAGLHERAGDLAHHLGRPADALAAYRKGHAFRKAVELARSAAPASMDAAINHFIEAGATLKAIDAAIAARQFSKAAGIVDFLEPAKAAPFFRRIAQHHEEANNRRGRGDAELRARTARTARTARPPHAAAAAAAACREEAERFLLRAGAPMEAVEMWLRADAWEAAQKVARGYLSEGELAAFYARRARACEAARAWADAERAYVAGGEVDAAIAMHRRARAWPAMLKLVAAHRREGLAAAHVLVAQALQGEGAWRDAERHFCEAKDWQAAVAMHRGQGAWEDALRVAKVFGGLAATKQASRGGGGGLRACVAAGRRAFGRLTGLHRGATMLPQVAYAWAISLSQDDAAALLRRLGLGEGAVDAAVEAGAWAHAFQLAELAARARLPDVHLRYAMALEDAGRFAEAEAEFVAAGKPREAIDMHLHCQDWDAALRRCAGHELGAAPARPRRATQRAAPQASAAAAAGQHGAAEALYLRAKRPEGALAMYRAAGDWDAALRVAQAYLPGKLQARRPRGALGWEIHLEMASAPAAGGGGAEAALARGRAFERGHDAARAIEAYLSASPGDGADPDALQRCWEQAANVVMQQQRHRLPEVVAAVAQRLVGIGRVAAAAELQEGAGDVHGAIATLCGGGLFDCARAAAGGNPQLLAAVEEAQTASLVAANDAEQLAARGNAGAAVEMFAAQGNWARAHKLAAQAGPELAAALAVRHAGLLARQRDWPAAAEVLATHGVSADPGCLELCREVALEVLGASQAQRSEAAEEHTRALLWRLVPLLEGRAGAAAAQDAADFGRLRWAAHYTALANRARAAGLLHLAARQLTSALRYAGIIPADRAFYEAGVAWRAAGGASAASVLLNRFLDLADALDDPAAPAALEGADFAGTELPLDAPLPGAPYAGDAAREEARNYVLEVSMDARVAQALPTRRCARCAVDTFEANLACHACGEAWPACVVTGYPVPPGEAVAPPGRACAGLVARRDDWNAWVGALRADPVTGAPASPLH